MAESVAAAVYTVDVGASAHAGVEEAGDSVAFVGEPAVVVGEVAAEDKAAIEEAVVALAAVDNKIAAFDCTLGYSEYGRAGRYFALDTEPSVLEGVRKQVEDTVVNGKKI